MPETLHPPYGVYQPRVLNRWLDINSQNGPLTRSRYNIILPAFDIDVTWSVADEIVGIFDYLSTHTFSIIDLTQLPVNPNYSLTIAYANKDGSVIRYLLNSGYNNTLATSIPLYTGQLIKPFFRFEIWSTNTTEASQTTPITMPTSILSNTDYRYSVDSTLNGILPLVTTFSVPLPLVLIWHPELNAYAVTFPSAMYLNVT